jgi:hypothetical protein
MLPRIIVVSLLECELSFRKGIVSEETISLSHRCSRGSAIFPNRDVPVLEGFTL